MMKTMADYYRHYPAPVRDFKAWYYDISWSTKWCGIDCWKPPNDLSMYQEVLTEVRPTRIVEFGAKFGGSALFFAHMLHILGIEDGQVLSIDTDLSYCTNVNHPNVQFMESDSTSPEAVEAVHQFCASSQGPILISEDSFHDYGHVASELKLYHKLITPGSYFVVEDSGMGDGLQDEPSGVCNACFEFLVEHPNWKVDWLRNRLGHTTIHGGFLQRVR